VSSLRECTLVLTDIEGSTLLWEREPEMGSAIARHDDLVRTAVSDAGGVLVKHKGEGDSTFSVFDAAGSAVAAALALQQAMTEESWPMSMPIRVRLGIDSGTVEERDGDFYGRPVNRAARVRGLAAGGTIVITTSTIERLTDPLPDGAGLVDLGEHALRGVEGLVELVAVAHPALADPAAALAHVRLRAAPPVPAGLRLHADAPLVGRERELDALTTAWNAATTGRASVALVAGEPGVGKTRLLAALAQRVADDGGLILHGRCDEEAVRAYQPFAEAVADASARLSGDDLMRLAGGSGADLAVVVPELRRRFLIAESPSSERFVVFEAVTSFIGDLAYDRPVLLVAEDLHWADMATLALFRHLARRLAGHPVLLAASYRNTDVDDHDALVRSLVTVRGDADTLEVQLEGLPREAVAAVLGPAHSDRLDQVWAASNGNPFFVVELRRALEDGRAGIPVTVRQAVGSRVEGLPAHSRRLVSVAAVAGEDVQLGTAALAAAVEPGDVRPAIARGLLADLDLHDRFRFVHALVREAVLDRLTSVERRDFHHRIASAVEERHGQDLERHAALLAHHHREAGERSAGGSAYTWSMRAGQSAGRSLAYEEAEREFRAAAAIAEGAGDVSGRLAAELELAEVLQRSGRPAEGREVAARVEVAAVSAEDPELRAWAVFTGRFGQALGLPESMDAIGDARRALPPESLWRVPLDVLLAGELVQAGDVDAGIALLDEAAAGAHAEGDAVALGLALTGRHMYVDRIETSVDEILGVLSGVDAPTLPSLRLSPAVLRVQTESLRIGELIAGGRITGARQAADDFVARYGDESGAVEANVPLFRITDALFSGDWPAWRRFRDELRNDVELASAYQAQLMACEMFATSVRRGYGDLAPAIEGLPASMMLVRPTLAVAYAEAGRHAAAREVLEAYAAEAPFEARVRTVAGRCELAMIGRAVALLDDREHAAQILSLFEPRCGQIAAWAGWAVLGAFDELAGLLAATCRRNDDAIEHFRDALAVYERSGWRALAVPAQAALAIALADRDGPGDTEEAARLATDSRREAEILGLAPVLRRLSAQEVP
jgi:class 3 adenylate cyclase/tetratricopeptide (TPR) repeat protein